MKENRFNLKWFASFVLIMMLLAACGGEEPTPTLVPTVPPPTAAPPEVAAPEMAALQNMTYKIDTTQSGEAPLTNGEYRESTAPGSATETVVTMTEHVAFGTLSDGEPAAAVVLTSDPGGSGTFNYLAVVKLVNGQPVNVATTLLGDRVQIKSVAITNGEIVVDMVTHGPDDPMCCPTQRVVQTYSLQGEQLVQTSSEVVGTVEPEEVPEISQPIYRWGEVADRLWVLVGYGDAANPTVVEEGTTITAVFSSVEPTVNGSGGCNNYFAGYSSMDDGGLTIEGPIGSTMMFCETGGDQELAYLSALETVTNWAINEAGRLELTYSTGQPFEEKLVYAPGETPLVGTTWRLVSYGDPDDLLEVEKGTTVTAVFSPETDTTGTVSGNATCNSYTTGYTIDGDQISFGPIAGTMMMCPIGADQEVAYLAALETASTYQIAGSNLQITYDGGVLNYSSQNLPLENVLWQATMVLGQEVPEEVEITALFTPGEEEGTATVGGSTGCNNYNTSYETSSDISVNPPIHFITISSPMAMTMAMCPDEALAELEQSYLAALESAETYDILGDQMVIHTADGDIQLAADRQPLEGTLWSLIGRGSIHDPKPPVEGSDFTAQFSRLPALPSGTVVGTTGCNDYNATYTANVSEIKVNLPALTGNEDCPWGAGNYEVEQEFFLALNSATHYRIIGNLLQIPYGDPPNQALIFVATQPPVEEVLDLSPLHNTFWYLSAIGEASVLPGTEVTAGFEINADGTSGTMSGSGGCNAYNTAIGANFAVGPIASTQRACETAVMDQESTYFGWLGSAYNYNRAGDQLLISTANGVLTFNSQPILDQSRQLQNVTWYAISYEQATAVRGSNPTAFFASDGSSLSGKTGCNDYNGTYKAEQGNKLSISGFASTQAACASDALTRQEQAFLKLLPTAVRYSVSGNQLQIVTAEGGTLNFSATPPEPVGPTAVIVAPNLGETGQVLTFDGYQSKAGSAPIVSYEWDMGDGTQFYGPVYQYAYGTAGTFNVKLTVVDKPGLRNTATHVVQINPVVNVEPPKAAIEGPGMAFVGESVIFSATSSQQGTGAIAGYLWQSGDGNNTAQVPQNTFTTIYARAGTYYPSVTVVDANNLSDSASMAIVINAQLEGTDWILGNTISGTSITLNFGNGNVSGFAGCNSYNTSYITTLAAGPSNTISLGPISSTGQMCSEEIMNQEQGYLTSLQSASSYTISGATLTLTTGSGPLTFGAAMATPAVGP